MFLGGADPIALLVVVVGSEKCSGTYHYLAPVGEDG